MLMDLEYGSDVGQARSGNSHMRDDYTANWDCRERSNRHIASSRGDPSTIIEVT